MIPAALDTASMIPKIVCDTCGGQPTVEQCKDVLTQEHIFVMRCHGQSERFDVPIEMLEGAFECVRLVQEYVAFRRNKSLAGSAAKGLTEHVG